MKRANEDSQGETSQAKKVYDTSDNNITHTQRSGLASATASTETLVEPTPEETTPLTTNGTDSSDGIIAIAQTSSAVSGVDYAMPNTVNTNDTDSSDGIIAIDYRRPQATTDMSKCLDKRTATEIALALAPPTPPSRTPTPPPSRSPTPPLYITKSGTLTPTPPSRTPTPPSRSPTPPLCITKPRTPTPPLEIITPQTPP